MNTEIDALLPWYYPDWFYLSTFNDYNWGNFQMFFLGAAVLLAFLLRWVLRQRSAQKLPVAVPDKDIKTSLETIIRFLPDALMILAMAMIIVALARPQKTNEQVEQWTEGIDIMLAVDISESMKIEDFRPNRLEAAKRVARNFIDGRFQDRIGMAIFSGDAYSLSPLTTDYNLLKSLIEEIDFNKIKARGTAIGSALAVVTNRMLESESKTKVCILLSDGDNTAGNIDPITAAELARDKGIKVYTIAVGREGKVPFGKDFFGRPRMVENTLDETTLRKIAEIGQGKFYRVSDEQALAQVFQQIDQYEKAEIKESRFKNTTDFYQIYLSWAIALLLCWMLLKSTFISNVLLD